MKSLEQLMNDVYDKIKFDDIPDLGTIRGFRFDISKQRVLYKSPLAREHIQFVYSATQQLGEELAELVAKLQFEYEVVHEIRIHLQRKVTDDFFGAKHEIVYRDKRFNKRQFSKFNWYDSDESHLGFLYRDSPVANFIQDFPDGLKNRNRDILGDILKLEKLAGVYWNVLVYAVKHKKFTNTTALEEGFQAEYRRAFRK